jgi:hypothetical protein
MDKDKDKDKNKSTSFKNRKEDQTGTAGQSRPIGESSPNPHGEARVIEMPIRTDHKNQKHANIAQSTSTVKNRMNPSVIEPISNAPISNAPSSKDPIAHENVDPKSLDTDSMYNNADPQGGGGPEPGTSGSRNKKKNRRMA